MKRAMRCAAAAAVVWLCGPAKGAEIKTAAEGGPEWLARAAEAVVMIDHRGFGGGSGTLVAEDLVLTCDHLFRDERGRQGGLGRVVVTFASGAASEGELVQEDPVWDLALVRLVRPPRDVTPIAVSSRLPAVGEAVFACGYGGRGVVQTSAGRVKGFARDKTQSSGAADTLVISGAARSGDSGGPMFNAQGELCGVLWGTNQTEIVGTQCGRCWEFGRDYFGRPGQSPGRCPGGSCPAPRSPAAGPTPPSKGPRDENGKPAGGSGPPPAAAERDTELARVRGELAEVKKQLEALSARAATAGPPGPPGPKGDAGRDAEVDLDRLTAAVGSRLAGSLRVKVRPLAGP